MKNWRTSTAAAVAMLFVLASCGDSAVDPAKAESAVESATEAGKSASPDDSSSPSPSTAGSTTAPIADPERALDPPGPLVGRIETADILIVSQDTISEDLVKQVQAIKGVAAVEQISLAQVSLENEVYNLAAINPSTYRRFTPPASAELQEQWDRIAGGEVAILPEMRKQVPIDENGYLTLGKGKDAEPVHVGAYAPQMLQVDAVVNTSWGEELGMTKNNALAISTRITSPATVSEPLRTLVGDGFSVQNLDVVAREGLDPSAVQTALLVGSFGDAVGTYRYTVSGGRVVPDPGWVSSRIGTVQVPVLGSMTCNRAIFPQLQAAFREIVDRGLADKINPGEYAGCYNARFIANSNRLSNHSFGLAFDVNVPGNLRGTVGEIDRGIVQIFKKWGFSWGGDWNYTDPMHFELNRIVKPG